MGSNQQNKLICGTCRKKFSSVSTRNRHVKRIHNEAVETRQFHHLKCPICPEGKQDPFSQHSSLTHHLTQVHNRSIIETNLCFRNIEEFKEWRSQDSRGVDYPLTRSVNGPNGDVRTYYNCNRSDLKGFKSTCTKRAMKTGGSIKIYGVCPSRMSAKFLGNGTVSVKFIETHVGHEDERRSKRRIKKKQTQIGEQSTAGVSNEKILQDDASKVDGDQLEKSESVSRVIKEEDSNSEENLCIWEPTTNKIEYNKETCQQVSREPEIINSERRREVALEEFVNYAKTLEDKYFDEFISVIGSAKKAIEEKRNQLSRKRKLAKRYYPNKK